MEFCRASLKRAAIFPSGEYCNKNNSGEITNNVVYSPLYGYANPCIVQVGDAETENYERK
jgi:hypothetical protein